MQIKTVTPDFSVTPQVEIDDFPAIAEAGFRTIFCHRPDGEGEGQPVAQSLADAASAHGIAFHHVPITPGEFDAEKIAKFLNLRRVCEGPVLGFCKTGARAVTVDALANHTGCSADERINAANAAGYDISARREELAKS